MFWKKWLFCLFDFTIFWKGGDLDLPSCFHSEPPRWVVHWAGWEAHLAKGHVSRDLLKDVDVAMLIKGNQWLISLGGVHYGGGVYRLTIAILQGMKYMWISTVFHFGWSESLIWVNRFQILLSFQTCQFNNTRLTCVIYHNIHVFFSLAKFDVGVKRIVFLFSSRKPPNKNQRHSSKKKHVKLRLHLSLWSENPNP